MTPEDHFLKLNFPVRCKLCQAVVLCYRLDHPELVQGGWSLRCDCGYVEFKCDRLGWPERRRETGTCWGESD